LNKKYVDSVSLAVFRISFGILMLLSMIRFWYNGWIKTLYIDPEFHFSYYGFGWIKVLGDYTYIIFIICSLASILVAVGYKYRYSIIVFFLSFTYIELMDKTTYLNHYYFISSISFLMCFLPLNANYSLDSIFTKKYYKVPRWTIDSIKLLICIVYFYAGIAKINSDWLLNAMPLSIWLPSKYDLPIIGENLMQKQWVHYFMSWAGMFYDLMIPFLLLIKRTRIVAFLLVVFFHLFTAVLFPIGMFPYIMIVGSLIFFDDNTQHKILNIYRKIYRYFIKIFDISITHLKKRTQIKSPLINKYNLIIIGFFFLLQLIIPFRYFFYPGELFWNEQGYRFSWRVMLIEKRGYSNFKVVDSISKKYFYVQNDDFLTSYQEKQMSFQPDFILEYAHFLGDHFTSQGHKNVQIFVDSHVALNGRSSQRFIDPAVDLYNEKESFKHKNWIIPFNDEIKGF
tara:strand:- start:10367 stop:11725 length:1359 start_codon:yes stop_codon:yes gene_type:complete